MNGIKLIAAERKRQIEEEGWTEQHDDQHKDGELALAAACYALPEDERFYPDEDRPDGKVPVIFPFEGSYWKPGPSRIRELVKAGALIAAEIDRLRREAGMREGGT